MLVFVSRYDNVGYNIVSGSGSVWHEVAAMRSCAWQGGGALHRVAIWYFSLLN